MLFTPSCSSGNAWHVPPQVRLIVEERDLQSATQLLRAQLFGVTEVRKLLLIEMQTNIRQFAPKMSRQRRSDSRPDRNSNVREKTYVVDPAISVAHRVTHRADHKLPFSSSDGVERNADGQAAAL